MVTGASGLLGANLVLTAIDDGHEVVAVCHRLPITLEGVDVVCADLSQPGIAQHLTSVHAPEWVVHCAAATNVDNCEEDPEMAFRLNRDMAGWMAEGAWLIGARLIHISTDAVFDGERGNYREDDTPNPINIYARSKLAGEKAVAAAHPEAAIVRTNIYGWNAQPKLSMAEWFLEQFEQGKRCPGFSDVWVTPILVNDLASLLLQMLEVKLSGVYHVVGDECVSKYEFGVRLAKIFGLDPSLIEPVSVNDAGLRAPRAQRMCLKGEKVTNSLGAQLPDVNTGLHRFCELRRDNFLTRLKGLVERDQ